MGRGSRWGLLAALWGAVTLLLGGGCAPAFALPATAVRSLATTTFPEPNDPAYRAPLGDLRVQWPLDQIGARIAWQRFPGRYFTADTRPRETPIVAVVSTGVDELHPDFRNPGAASAEVGAGGQLLLSAARTFLSSRGGPQSGAHDEHGLGTHLAGLIAAATNNAEGMAGVAFPVRLLPLRVTDARGGAAESDVVDAIRYAADLGASAILIGVTFAGWSQSLQSAIDYAWDRGSLVIAPTGDMGGDTATYPGACPHVLAISALDVQGRLAPYSTRSGAALAAPGGEDGVGVYSTLPTYACTLRTDLSTPAYGRLFGGAIAAAHAAGAAGWQAAATGSRPQTGEEAAEIWRALQRSAIPFSESSGCGRLAMDRLASDSVTESAAGGIVGRALLAGAPAIGAAITARDDLTGRESSVFSSWPAGAYRIANLPSGSYSVTAEVGGAAGVWERVEVLANCDAPGVDFTLGSPPAAAALVGSSLPASAICGQPLSFSLTLLNTGAAAWSRGEGYRLLQLPAARALLLHPDHVALPSASPAMPGDAVTFTIRGQAPEAWGEYQTSWQLAQQGGVGRFGPVISGTVEVTSFTDVGVHHWAIAWIEAAKAAGIVTGLGNGAYDPSSPVTRAQMAVYLARALVGEAAVPAAADSGPPRFVDVDPDYWAFRYVQLIAAQNLAAGYPGNEYRPEEIVNRGQMAIFIARAIATPTAADELGGYQPPASPTFEDVPKEHWAYRHVEYIKSHGIASGYPDKLYHPLDNCTRDQMAVYVTRAFGFAG